MMTAQLRFWFLVAGTTLLIWIATDQRVTRTVELTIPIEFRPANRDSMMIRSVDSELKAVTVTFSGANRVIADLQNSQDNLRAEVVISDRLSNVYAVDLLRELSSQPSRFPEGVAVVAVSPPSVDIEVDRYVAQEIRLEVQSGDVVFEGLPQIVPPTAKVTVPEKRFEQLRPEQRVISLPMASLYQNAPEGQLVQKEVAVPRQFGGLTALSVEPAQVQVSAIRQERTRTGRIPTVSIRLLVSSDVTDDFVIQMGDDEGGVVTRELAVRGPAAVIRLLEENPSAYDIKGFVEISREDALNARKGVMSIQKLPTFINLPEGVRVEGNVEKVKVQLTPRS